MGLRDTTKNCGFSQLTSLSSSTALTIPTQQNEPTYAIIQCESQVVRWRDDGTAPTASVGMRLTVGAELRYDGDLKAIRFIEEAASAKLDISFYY